MFYPSSSFMQEIQQLTVLNKKHIRSIQIVAYFNNIEKTNE
jgi:hypothetical protein